MNRKYVLIIIAIMTLLLVGFVIIVNRDIKLSRISVSEDRFNDIKKVRKESKSLVLDSISFNDYNLFLDNKSNTYYYSIVNNISNKYNPDIKYTSSNKVNVAFLEEEINEDRIKNNYDYKLIIYDDIYYNVYNLKITKLPVLSINYVVSNNKSFDMDLNLFNNMDKVNSRLIKSKGEIEVSENSNGEDDYKFSLKVDSVGGNERENNISILGIQQHSEYVLDSMNSDNDNVRNLFALNLWNKTVNSNIDSYNYVELLVNGEYKGLYALGYNLESESLRLNNNEFLFYKTKKVNSENVLSSSDTQLEGYKLFDSNINKIKKDDNIQDDCRGEECSELYPWIELNNYYAEINSGDINRIKNVSNIDNSIKLYLFYLFIQSNNVVGDSFTNTYMVFRKNNDNYKVEYIPRKLSYSFGNILNEEKVLSNVEASNNDFIMNYNPVSKLIELGDMDTIKRVKEIYEDLRNNEWSISNINKMMDEYKKSIYDSGSILRNNNKYNIENSNNNLNDIKSYINERLKYMDDFIDNL